MGNRGLTKQAETATGGQTQTAENRVNLFRLEKLIIDGGLLVLRNILDQTLTAKGVTLRACLNVEKSAIKRLKSRGIITQVQYNQLFPKAGQGPTTSDMDITLIICLLRCLKCVGLDKKFDWNATPELTDVTVEADIYRLKALLNRISHTTIIHPYEIVTWWNEIEQILARLSSPSLNIQQTINDFKTCPLDPEEEKRVQEEIKKWKDYEAIVDRLKGEMTDVKEMVTEVEKKQKDINRQQDEEKSKEGFLSMQTEKTIYQKRAHGYLPFELEKESIEWSRCITKGSEAAAQILMERKILPSQRQLNKACLIFGVKSHIFSEICSMISKHIKTKSENVIDVWPSYRNDHVLQSSYVSIVFVVVGKKNSGYSVSKENYQCYIKCENDYSYEGQIVAIKEMQSHTFDIQSADAVLEEMRKCVNKNADDLFKKHSNLNVILPSLMKSVGYMSSKHDIKIKPCIALYVSVKGCIPLNETLFEKEIDGFPTDVLEGEFEPFIGGPNQYHTHLKMGVAIHANVIVENKIFGGTLGGFIEHSVHGLCGITSAHVVCDSAELARLKTAKELHLNKTAYQPINECMAAFGEVVLAVYNEGSESESGIEVALITINDRKPKDGSFPNAFNDLEAGFDTKNQLCFNSGEVREISNSMRWTVVYKFGMSSGITRGTFALYGGVVRKDMQGQCNGFGYNLKNQIKIIQIGDNPFAEHGDSGALVLIKGTHDYAAIGIVEGGMRGCVFVTPIRDILRAVGYTDVKMYRFTPECNEVLTVSEVEMDVS